MEQADAERPSGGPSRRRLESSKGKVGTASALLGDGQDGDEDGNKSGKGPENGKRLWFPTLASLTRKGA